MTRSLRTVLLATVSALCVAAPASAAVPPLGDAVMSSNVEYLGSLKQDVGLTTGAKVVGDRMFVTSGKNISIYDISDPAAPKPLGTMKANIAWENEEVPTNGKVLAVASDFYSVGVPECVAAMRGIDILRWKGEHYVPGAAPEAGRVRGTRGVTKPQAPNAAQAARRDALAGQLSAAGWSPGLCSLSAQRL